MLHEQRVDDLLCEVLRVQAKPADLSVWDRLVDRLEHPAHTVRIAMVGKYVELTESYKSLSEALTHAGIHTESRVVIDYIDSEQIERDGVALDASPVGDPPLERGGQVLQRHDW